MSRTTGRAASCIGAESEISHSQQSLHRRHFSHKWLLHESLVQRAQMRVDSSPQILHVKGIRYFFLPVVLAGAGAAIKAARQR